EIEIDEALVRGRGAFHFSFSWIALNKPIWEDIRNLPANYEPPPWEELLLDAQSDLPRVGPAVVLAATALEVFISYILDRLANAGSVPPRLWDWINKRGDYVREPTIAEQSVPSDRRPLADSAEVKGHGGAAAGDPQRLDD